MPHDLTLIQYVDLIDSAQILSPKRNLICCNFETRKYSLVAGRKEDHANSKEVPLSLNDIIEIGTLLEREHLVELKQAKGLSQSILAMSQNKETRFQEKNFLSKLITKICECFRNFFHGIGFQTTAEAAATFANRLGTPPLENRQPFKGNEDKEKDLPNVERPKTFPATKIVNETPKRRPPQTSKSLPTKLIIDSPLPKEKPQFEVDARIDLYRTVRNNCKNNLEESVKKPNIIYDSSPVKNNTNLDYSRISTTRKKRDSISNFLDDKSTRIDEQTLFREIIHVTVNSDLPAKTKILMAMGKSKIDFNDRITGHNAAKTLIQELRTSSTKAQIEILAWLNKDNLFTPEIMKICLDSLINKSGKFCKPDLENTVKNLILQATGNDKVDFNDEATSEKAFNILEEALEKNDLEFQIATLKWLNNEDLFTQEVMDICLNAIILKNEEKPDLGISVEGVIRLATGKDQVDFNDEKTGPAAVKIFKQILEKKGKTFQTPMLEWLDNKRLFTPKLIKTCLDTMIKKYEENQLDPYSLEIILNHYLNYHFNSLTGEDEIKLLPSDDESIVKACAILIEESPSINLDRVAVLIKKMIAYPEYKFTTFCRFMDVFNKKDAHKIIDSLTLRDDLVENYAKREEWHQLMLNTSLMFQNYIQQISLRINI